MWDKGIGSCLAKKKKEDKRWRHWKLVQLGFSSVNIVLLLVDLITMAQWMNGTCTHSPCSMLDGISWVHLFNECLPWALGPTLSYSYKRGVGWSWQILRTILQSSIPHSQVHPPVQLVWTDLLNKIILPTSEGWWIMTSHFIIC